MVSMPRFMYKIIAIFLFLLSCLGAYSDNHIPSYALENALIRRTYSIDTIGAQHINVFTERDFTVAVTNRPIVFELRNNITINSPIRFHGGKSYYIKGNGFSITEKHSPSPKRSLPYQAKSWSLDKKKKQLTIRLKSPINIRQFQNRDSIYVVYEGWYIRFKERLISVNDSVLTFNCNDKFLSSPKFFSLTPYPFFYLEENPTDRHLLKYMFVVLKGAKLLIDGITFRGASTCCIYNLGTLKVHGCNFSDFKKEGISSIGELYVDNSRFSNITSACIMSMPKSYLDVENSEFRECGLYGSNQACISARGNSYIARNTFANFNYSAVALGYKSKYTEKFPSSIVEKNILLWTPEWEQKMKIFALIDGGAIHISTCNKRTIVRHNTIINFGGHGYNRAIYCDDGAFNVTIYGNVIKGTRNSYDIDSRDCSRKWQKQKDTTNCPNTGNYIGYNICDGKLKLEGASAVSDNGCIFENNIIVNKHDDGNSIIRNVKRSNSAIVYDPQGYIDKNGNVKLKKTKKLVNIKAPVLMKNK